MPREKEFVFRFFFFFFFWLGFLLTKDSFPLTNFFMLPNTGKCGKRFFIEGFLETNRVYNFNSLIKMYLFNLVFLFFL